MLLVISPMTVPSLLSEHVLSSCWNVKGPSGIHPVTTVCDKVCPSTPVSSTNKTDRHDITEILFKVALSKIN
jgi:hypothetical protein